MSAKRKKPVAKRPAAAKKAPPAPAAEPDKPARPPAPVQVRPLSVAALREAIPKYAGNLAAVARSFGVTRGSVWGYVEAHDELKAVVKDARETRLDNAESSLDRAVLAGEGWAVTLILKTLGKDRGYVEKQQHEHTGKNGGPIQYADATDDDLDAEIRRLQGV